MKRGVAAERSMKPPVLPPVLFLICAGAGALVQFIKPAPIGSYSFEGGFTAGAVMMLIGAAIGGGAIVAMHRRGTPIEPGREPTQLVTNGPFRFTRNPLYLVLVMLCTAIAVMANSLWLLIAALVLFVLLDRTVIAREEAVLTRTFATEYAAYRARVRRWL